MLKLNKSLLKGSVILIVYFGIFNILNFAFHFFMARKLTLSDYGVLASLFSIIYILGIFMESIQIVLTKYSAEEQNKGKLKNIFKRALRKSVFASLLVFLAYCLLSFPLSYLLKIDFSLMILNGLVIFLIFFIPVSRGVLQGLKRFNSLGFNMILESGGKLVLALIFVYWGFQIYGAVIGIILGVSIAFLLSLFSLRDILHQKEEEAITPGIYNYTKPAFLIMLIIFLLYNLDVVIAKIMFPSEVAGSYAIASMLGKTIFLFTQPISRAMFPLSAENKSKKSKSSKIFLDSLLFISLIVIFALIIFYFFPGELVKIFSGKDINLSASILFYLAVAFSLLSFANLKLLYDLSINRIRGYPYLLIFLILEIAVLIIFSNNLLEYSLAFIVSSLIFLIGSTIILRKAG